MSRRFRLTWTVALLAVGTVAGCSGRGGTISPFLESRIERMGLEDAAEPDDSGTITDGRGYWRRLDSGRIPSGGDGYHCLAGVQVMLAQYLEASARRLGYESSWEMVAAGRRMGPTGELTCWTPPATAGTDGLTIVRDVFGIHTATWVADDNLTRSGCRVWAKRPDGAADGRAFWAARLTGILGLANPEAGSAGAADTVRALARDGRLHAERNDSVLAAILPGDLVTAHYPQSDYGEHYVTHALIYLGKRNGRHCFAEQFGPDGDIIEYEDLVRRHHPKGIENTFRPFVVIDRDAADAIGSGRQELPVSPPGAIFLFPGEVCPRVDLRGYIR